MDRRRLELGDQYQETASSDVRLYVRTHYLVSSCVNCGQQGKKNEVVAASHLGRCVVVASVFSFPVPNLFAPNCVTESGVTIQSTLESSIVSLSSSSIANLMQKLRTQSHTYLMSMCRRAFGDKVIE
jgi:hypothetical protein